MDMILLPGGALRASVWDTESRETVVRDVTEDLPFFLRSVVRLHDRVTLCDLLLLADQHRDFLLPLFTDLLDEFVEEVRRPTTHEELCDLDYLEISWECYFEKRRFDLQPVLVGRNHRDDHVYSVEAVPTNAMGHLPVMLRSSFQFAPPPLPAAQSYAGEPSVAALTLVQSSAPPLTAALSPTQPAAATELRRDFLLFDVFDAVLAEITFHGDPAERDRWWREIGSHGLDFTDRPSEDEV